MLGHRYLKRVTGHPPRVPEDPRRVGSATLRGWGWPPSEGGIPTLWGTPSHPSGVSGHPEQGGAGPWEGWHGTLRRLPRHPPEDWDPHPPRVVAHPPKVRRTPPEAPVHTRERFGPHPQKLRLTASNGSRFTLKRH